MTELQRRGCLAIDPSKVTYMPGSYDKRFAQSMAQLALREDWADVELSPAQARLVWRKVVMYRRQIKRAKSDPGIVKIAEDQLEQLAALAAKDEGAMTNG